MPPIPHDPTLAVGWIQLALAALLTLGLTSVVALVIRKPLFGVLQLVCGSDVGARFWTTFAGVLLVFGPLFLVFTAGGTTTNLADFVRRTVYLAALGVVGAFLVMGAAVMFNAPGQVMSRHRADSIEREQSAKQTDAAAE